MNESPLSAQVSVSADPSPPIATLLHSLLPQADARYAPEEWRAAQDFPNLTVEAARGPAQIHAVLGDPNEVGLLLHLAKCEYECDPVSARWCFERVLALDPSNPIALAALQILPANHSDSPVASGWSTSGVCESRG